MIERNTETTVFDVFLCHNSDDKAEIREVADKLTKLGMKPWLDEDEIRPGTLWQSALEEQITNIKSAAIFVGKNGIGPWQDIEIRAFISEFVERDCPVIPAILPNADKVPTLPVLLKNLHYVDFRISDPDPYSQIQWGITGKKPNFCANPELSGKTDLLPEKEKQSIEIRLPGKLDDFSTNEKEKFVAALSMLIQIDGTVTITEIRPGSIRLFLELTPKQADKIYEASINGRLDSLGITEARLYPSLMNPPDKEQRAQLLILQNKVEEQWIEGVLKQSLYHQILIDLGKHTVNDAVDPPWNRAIELPKQRQQLQLMNFRIETVFDATGLLLILGEPGSGKTITLLELASILINRAASDSKERIPIVLNLSSWQKSQTLTEWMIDRLSSLYQVPSKLAQIWLNAGYIIPLLDGLDEVRAENQPDCAEAINKFIDEVNPAGLVVCSRLKEYQWLPERLKLNGAICIEPLNQEQIDSYFASLGSELESLRSAIQEDDTLKELAQSPLMLNIMSLAYQSIELRNLNDKTLSVEERRKEIFDAYVKNMFDRKTSLKEKFIKEKAIEWLSWFARKMKIQSQSILSVESLQPNWLDNSKQKFAYVGTIYLITAFTGFFLGSVIYDNTLGLILGFTFSMSIFLPPRDDDFSSDLLNVIMSFLLLLFTIFIISIFSSKFYEPLSVEIFSPLSLLLILPCILYAIIRFDPFANIKTIEIFRWSWKIFFQNLWKGILVSGIIFGVVVGFFYIFNFDFIDIELIILGGILFCLPIGLFKGLDRALITEIDEGKHTPNQGIILSIKNGIYVGLVTAILTFFIIAVAAILMFSIMFSKMDLFWVPADVKFSILLGIVAAIPYGFAPAIKHYVLRLLFFLNGNIPIQLIPFLNYCTKIILLKKIGGNYIFIHRMLLEYFANLKNTDSKSAKSIK